MNEKILWNDGWTFLKTKPGTTFTQAAERFQEFKPVDIPHDWLIYDSLNLYEDSTGWYKKTFKYEPDDEKNAFIIFEGIYMDSTVYINGVKAGEWKYGYSAFILDAADFLKSGENEILVSVCFLSPNSRWYSGAGIYRDVWFKVTDKVYIPENGVYISTKAQADGSYMLYVDAEIVEKKVAISPDRVEVEFSLYDESGSKVELELVPMPETECIKRESTLKEDAKTVTAECIETMAAERTKSASKCSVARQYQVKNIKLWDLDAPILYTFQTKLVIDGKTVQQEEEKIGFRHIEYDAQKGFFLNGKHMKLNGVCEHHDLGALGAAFNKSAMRRKYTILKEMGVNAVRGAHNMMAQGAIELADEMGMLILSEAFDMWERPKTTYDYARFFKEWAERDVESWIKRDRNHPSVIMWSIGNEIYDTHADEHGMELTIYLKEIVEKYDYMKNAPATLCSNYMPWENTQKCADVLKLIGYNYAERYYKEHHAKHPDWIIYGSETSSIVQSRGVYHFPLKAGILAEEDEQCSALGNSTTSWSAKSMEACITEDRDMEFSLGQFIWSGFDYIGEPTPYHTKNSYFGQIDTAGFPKDSFYVWKSAWTDYKKEPMVHIFPYWDFNEGQLIDVRVCSNAPYVELFINGRSLGKQHLTHEAGSGNHIIADYQVPYEKGVLSAIAYDYDEKKVADTERHSFGNSASIVLETENKTVKADGRDLLFFDISTVDEAGNPVENACDRVKVKVSGAGRLVGLDNGDSTDHDSYKGTSRRLFNGKLLAIVQTNMQPGEIKVEVNGKGIKGASVCCESYEDPDICCKERKDAAADSKDCKDAAVCRDNREYMDSANKCDRNKPGSALTTLEANTDKKIVLGAADEIPVRRINLKSLGGQKFTQDNDTIVVEAYVEPADATDHELSFRAVNDTGVTTNLAGLEYKENRAVMKAIGDGDFRLFAMSKSGSDKVRIMSQLEFSIEGFGQAYKNPYELIAGSLYTSVPVGEVGCGNEKGVATGREDETVVYFNNIDFGSVGSDEITIPIFALNDDEYPMQIWEGIPGEEGSVMLADVIYQKPSIWNVYQPEIYKLNKRLKGITSISFRLYQKVHIKGFYFTKYEKAWLELNAGEADAVYGDSFVRNGTKIEGIGNNVTLEFTEMDFGGRSVKGIAIDGRAVGGVNTIHVRMYNGAEEIKQIVEFPESSEYGVQEFALEPVSGKWNVAFVFLPGSNFDFANFRFY
ncbi:MAG: DUF4982 domain-containing protein [Butyrivibrio sp.]|nr:DUF4982 domain-containing protein [Butyrivibrio sp.]